MSFRSFQKLSIRAVALAFWFVTMLAGVGLATSVEKFSIVQDATTIGTISAVTEGAVVNVDYAVNENGRGPKHHETIRVGPNFIPVEWSVSGTSLMGGPVSEKYSWQSGRAAWTSQADHGDAPAPKPPLYVVNDDSPWALVVYARALLKTSEPYAGRAAQRHDETNRGPKHGHRPGQGCCSGDGLSHRRRQIGVRLPHA